MRRMIIYTAKWFFFSQKDPLPGSSKQLASLMHLKFNMLYKCINSCAHFQARFHCEKLTASSTGSTFALPPKDNSPAFLVFSSECGLSGGQGLCLLDVWFCFLAPQTFWGGQYLLVLMRWTEPERHLLTSLSCSLWGVFIDICKTCIKKFFFGHSASWRDWDALWRPWEPASPSQPLFVSSRRSTAVIPTHTLTVRLSQLQGAVLSCFPKSIHFIAWGTFTR